MDTLHAMLIAVIQGATELFPVSSLGHAVLVPAVFRWSIDQRAPEFLPFLVMLHVGTTGWRSCAACSACPARRTRSPRAGGCSC